MGIQEVPIRGFTCPTCNPSLDNPDLFEDKYGEIKYLLFDRLKCRHCGDTLIDVGPCAPLPKEEE